MGFRFSDEPITEDDASHEADRAEQGEEPSDDHLRHHIVNQRAEKAIARDRQNLKSGPKEAENGKAARHHAGRVRS